jgi:hypothetical protein
MSAAGTPATQVNPSEMERMAVSGFIKSGIEWFWQASLF